MCVFRRERDGRERVKERVQMDFSPGINHCRHRNKLTVVMDG